MIENIVGALGTLVSVVMFWPQAIRIRNLRHDPVALSGVSALGQVGVLINASTWLVYAAVTSAWWSGAPGLVNIPVAGYCLWALRSRSGDPFHAEALPHAEPGLPHAEPGSGRCQICLTDPTSAKSHGWYVTNAPGHGTVVFPCNGGLTIGYPVAVAESVRGF